MKPLLEKCRAHGRQFCKRAVFYGKAYRRLELMARSASLSFYTMISIFPLIFILVTLSRTFFDTSALHLEIREFLAKALPLESDLIWQNMNQLFKAKTSVSVYNLLALFLSSQMLYVNLERILNTVLHTNVTRNFFKTRLLFFVWLTAMLAVLFSPVLVTLVSSVLKSVGVRAELWARLSGHVGFFVASFFMFVAILWVVPRQKMPLKKLAVGATAFAVAVQIGKMIFKIFVQRNLLRYNLVYGSLASTMLVMLWIFYFYNVFLFCAYLTGRKRDPLYRTRLD